MAKLSKMEKLYNMLTTGQEFTSKQIAQRTGLESVSAAIRDVRAAGNKVKLNERTNSRGEKVFKYRMA